MGFSVYVHLPYCLRKCPYCDFNTYAVRSFPEERYLAALEREALFAARQPEWAGRRIDTVFLGGGTPSLFQPASFARLLATLDRAFGIEPDAEITMEANPGSLEGGGAERLAGFRAAGINRLSMGAQSFEARHLETLGRLHSPADTLAAVEGARRAGIENLSLDLIFAIPGQTVAEFERDLERIVSLGLEHVSAYNLTYEEGTPMTGMRRAGLVEAADEDTELAMFELARARLAAAGLEHYEISNYARPGRRSRHNLAYWTWRDYLGLGAGAHGFAAASVAGGTSAAIAYGDGTALAFDQGHNEPWGRRYANERIPESYIAAAEGAWHATDELLDRDMAVAEYLMLGLRLLEGIDESAFAQRFGEPVHTAAPALEGLVEQDMVERTDGRVRLTERGLLLADAVIARLAAG